MKTIDEIGIAESLDSIPVDQQRSIIEGFAHISACSDSDVLGRVRALRWNFYKEDEAYVCPYCHLLVDKQEQSVVDHLKRHGWSKRTPSVSSKPNLFFKLLSNTSKNSKASGTRLALMWCTLTKEFVVCRIFTSNHRKEQSEYDVRWQDWAKRTPLDLAKLMPKH